MRTSGLQKRIQAVRQTGARGRGRWLRICFGPDAEGGVVISVRRKFGKAVRRNQVRRRLRALLRELDDGTWDGRLIVIAVDDQAGGLSFQSLGEDLRRALKHAGVPMRENVKREVCKTRIS